MARNKFNAIKTTVEGVTFDSRREARRWQELKLLERAGEISRLERQVKFPLTVEGHLIANYTADFQYWTASPKARANGVKRWGARSIIEIIRYENVIKKGNRQFKVNNNEQAGLSRAYMDMRRCWGFFEIRGDAVLDRAA